MKTLILFLLLPFSTFASDRPSVHGMLVFGKNKIYVSHLPMFHSPHDYQLLAELELTPAVKQIYEKSLKEHPEETVYTLVPEQFSLPEMAAHPKSFSADLVRGHFERGGTTIAAQIQAKFKVIYFKKLDAADARPPQASFLIFGTKQEAFLAHLITARPDFDQIIETSGSTAVKDGEAVLLTSSNLPAAKPISAPADASFNGIDVKLTKELYLETGDLE